jgi:hypothetical protein
MLVVPGIVPAIFIAQIQFVTLTHWYWLCSSVGQHWMVTSHLCAICTIMIGLSMVHDQIYYMPFQCIMLLGVGGWWDSGVKSGVVMEIHDSGGEHQMTVHSMTSDKSLDSVGSTRSLTVWNASFHGNPWHCESPLAWHQRISVMVRVEIKRGLSLTTDRTLNSTRSINDLCYFKNSDMRNLSVVMQHWWQL